MRLLQASRQCVMGRAKVGGGDLSTAETAGFLPGTGNDGWRWKLPTAPCWMRNKKFEHDQTFWRRTLTAGRGRQGSGTDEGLRRRGWSWHPRPPPALLKKRGEIAVLKRIGWSWQCQWQWLGRKGSLWALQWGVPVSLQHQGWISCKSLAGRGTAEVFNSCQPGVAAEGLNLGSQ